VFLVLSICVCLSLYVYVSQCVCVLLYMCVSLSCVCISQCISELYGKVVKEHRYFINELGMSPDTATTLAAVRSVVGPVDKLKIVKITQAASETYVETSGTGDGGSKPQGVKISLTARQKDYYRRAIENGAYPDWNAVQAELKAYNS